MIKRILILFLLVLQVSALMAQIDRKLVRQGNKFYRIQNAEKAEVAYRKAVTVNPSNPQALYNLGCALMAQQKDSDAMVQFEAAAKLETAKMRKASVYHNIGWICQKNKLYNEAVNAYKESLRNNPKDDETRYNLALCMNQAKNQKQQQQQQKQDENEDKNGENNKKEEQNPSPKPQNDKMNKQTAERMIQAAMQQEKKTQQRMKDDQKKAVKRQLEKNW